MLDSTTIAAILMAVSGIITCFVGVRSKQIRLFSSYQTEFLERQIFEFLAPLDQIMTFHTSKDWIIIRFELMILFKEKYAFVPPMVLSEYSDVLINGEITEERFSELRAMVSSVYNWTRREVGHSCDYSKIKKRYIPYNEDIRKAKIYIFDFLAICDFLIGLLMIYLLITGENTEAIDWIMSAFLVGTVLLLFMI